MMTSKGNPHPRNLQFSQMSENFNPNLLKFHTFSKSHQGSFLRSCLSWITISISLKKLLISVFDSWFVQVRSSVGGDATGTALISSRNWIDLSREVCTDLLARLNMYFFHYCLRNYFFFSPIIWIQSLKICTLMSGHLTHNWWGLWYLHGFTQSFDLYW